MTSPEEVEAQHTLRTAVARYEELRSREVLADSADADSSEVADAERLPASEVLELLALSEVIARKARYGRQLAVRWIASQERQDRAGGHEGLDPDEAARLRRLAGSPDDEQPG
jgi:hypothetical protein